MYRIPAALAAILLAVCLTAQTAPPNDACADAIAIPVGTCYAGSVTGASFGGDTLPASCADGDITPNDVWFTTTVPASGEVRLDFVAIPGTAIALVEVYTGGCGSTTAPGLLLSTGSCAFRFVGNQLTLTGLSPSGTLLIRYWVLFGSPGTIELCVSAPLTGCTDPCAFNYNPFATIDDGSCTLPALVGDDCANPIPITAADADFYTDGSTGTDITSCTSGDSLDVWYAYAVPPGADTVDIYTCGSSFDTHLSVWDGCGGAELGCNDDGTPGAFGSTCGGSARQSYVQLTGPALASVAGGTVLIRVSGFGGQSGCGQLLIDESVVACDASGPPANLQSTNGTTRVTLQWDPPAGAVACQVQGQRLDLPGAMPTVNLLGPPLNTVDVPYAAAGPGSSWTWRARCACSLAPLDVSPFSAYTDTFAIPSARAEAGTGWDLFPNPATDAVWISPPPEAGSPLPATVSDPAGRVIWARSLDPSGAILRLDVSGWPAGVYTVRLGDGGVRRLLVTR